MLVNLSEVMNRKEEVQEIEATIDFQEFEMNGERYPVVSKTPLHLALSSSPAKKLFIKADGKLTLAAPCDRCLKEVLIPFSIHVDGEVDLSKTEEERAEDLDEACYIAGADLDTDRLVYEEILLDFPMKVLCREDCRGICKVCGADLNLGECGCDRTVLDPRMSVIQDIFKNFKEV